jgi:hypothetical protein
MSALDDKAAEILDKLSTMMTHYAPDVTHAAIQSVRISALNNLVGGIVGIFLTIAGIYAGIKLTNFFVRKKEAEGYWTEWEIAFGICAAITIILGIVGIITSIAALTDVWMWTSIFNPELGLAHKVSGL